MKPLILLFALAAAALAQAPKPDDYMPEPSELKNVKTRDIVTIEKNLPSYAGAFVKLKFTQRDKTVYESKPLEMWNGTIYLWDAKDELGSLSVLIPKDGLKWFMSVPTNVEARKPLYCYARIDRTGNARALIVGREIRTTAKGPELIW